MELKFGEKAIGVNSNPLQDEKVKRTKEICAELINIIESKNNEFEVMELKSWCISAFRTAAFNAVITASMAVVKFLTWEE